MKMLIYSILTLSFLCAVCACQKTEFREDVSAGNVSNMKFQFSISMMLDHPGTSCYEDTAHGIKRDNQDSRMLDLSRRIGTDFETWIDEERLHVLIYLQDQTSLTYIGEIEEIIPGSYSTVDGVFTFNFTGKTALELKVGTTYRFMITANSSIPTAPKFLNNPRYDLNSIDAKNGAIPLWGVATHTLEDKKEQAIPSMQLVRAISKIELVMSDNLKNNGFTFSKVQLNNYAQTGFAFPAKWADTETSSTDILIQRNPETHLFCPDGSSLNSSDVRYFSATDASNTDFVVYVPEYTIPTDNSSTVPFVDVVVKKDGVEYSFDKVVKFNDPKFYSPTVDITDPNQFHNIVRNNNYKFVAQSISAGHIVDLTCEIQPWKIHDETLDYEDYISALDNGKMKWSVKDYDYGTGTDEERKVYSTSDGITCTFGLSTPKNESWIAVLVPVSGSFDAFSFEENVNGQPTKIGLTTKGKIGSLHTLKIVQMKNVVMEPNIMQLKIYVKDRNERTFSVKPGILGGPYYIIQTVK